MTCIGRLSLSLGRGAELVEAERGDIMQAPLLSYKLIHLASPLRGGGCEHSEQTEGCYMYL